MHIFLWYVLLIFTYILIVCLKGLILSGYIEILSLPVSQKTDSIHAQDAFVIQTLGAIRQTHRRLNSPQRLPSLPLSFSCPLVTVHCNEEPNASVHFSLSYGPPAINLPSFEIEEDRERNLFADLLFIVAHCPVPRRGSRFARTLVSARSLDLSRISRARGLPIASRSVSGRFRSRFKDDPMNAGETKNRSHGELTERIVIHAQARKGNGKDKREGERLTANVNGSYLGRWSTPFDIPLYTHTHTHTHTHTYACMFVFMCIHASIPHMHTNTSYHGYRDRYNGIPRYINFGAHFSRPSIFSLARSFRFSRLLALSLSLEVRVTSYARRFILLSVLHRSYHPSATRNRGTIPQTFSPRKRNSIDKTAVVSPNDFNLWNKMHRGDKKWSFLLLHPFFSPLFPCRLTVVPFAHFDRENSEVVILFRDWRSLFSLSLSNCITLISPLSFPLAITISYFSCLF